MVLCGAACGCVYHHHPEQGCYQRTCHQDWGSSRMKMISKYSNIINQRIILPPPSLVSSVCLLISTNFRVLLEGFCWMRIYEFHQIPSQGLPSDVPRLQWVNYANLKRFLHWRGETRNLAFYHWLLSWRASDCWSVGGRLSQERVTLQLENQLWLSRACLAKTWKWEINATTKFHPAEIFIKYHSFTLLYIFNHFYRKYVLHPPPGGEVASLLAYENAKIPAEIFSWGGWTGYYQQQNRQELRT